MLTKSSGWVFTDRADGSFTMRDPVKNSRLYFPLCNNKLKSYVTPDLKGDILLDYDRYLTVPKSTEDLHHSKDGRSIWLDIKNKGVWNANGSSAEKALKDAQGITEEEVDITAGIGWFSIRRINTRLKIAVDTTVYIPANDDPVELLRFTISNLDAEAIDLIPYFALPLYARSTLNLRDHRDVSTLCNCLIPNPYGIINKPLMVHNETNSFQNPTHYVVLGSRSDGESTMGGWGRMIDFIGENGSLEAPEAVYQQTATISFADMDTTGEETVGALKFAPLHLEPGKSESYIIVSGITQDYTEIERWANEYKTAEQFAASLEETQQYWQDLVNLVQFQFPDEDLNKFLKWVNFQPHLRKRFGSSYLPDFGYGTGKRYWRELWQDLIALVIADPYSVKTDIMNNFNGVKLDGSNATLVGDKPGEFAHRSGLGRTWSDHGVWPYYTTSLFIEYTGDLSILAEKTLYYKDNFIRRGRQTDSNWQAEDGLIQKTQAGEAYYGTVLEHLLVQNLTSFFNVGVHNLTLQEAGDWDDTMDMAREHGETVQFTAFYGANLAGLCNYLSALYDEGIEEIDLLEDMLVLLDRIPGQETIDYADYRQKQRLLQRYYDSLEEGVSGKTCTVSITELIADLTAKADFVRQLVNAQEFISVQDAGEEYSFYNSYYTNEHERLCGVNAEGSVNISLTPQAYLMLLGYCDQQRACKIVRSVNKYLRNEFGGYMLRSDHRDLSLIEVMGRGFGLAFKTRENGGQYNHMVVKYMNGLYTNDLVHEAYEVFATLTGLCMDSSQCKIFPGVPASIDSKTARGSYNYLTGTASWLIYSLITEMFGFKSNLGNLEIAPKFVREQFGTENSISIDFIYQQKRMRIRIVNDANLDWREYCLGEVQLNQKPLQDELFADDRMTIIIPQDLVLQALSGYNEILIKFTKKD